jgi:hypothetical protein
MARRRRLLGSKLVAEKAPNYPICMLKHTLIRMLTTWTYQYIVVDLQLIAVFTPKSRGAAAKPKIDIDSEEKVSFENKWTMIERQNGR